MTRLDRLLRAAPYAPFAGQILLVVLFAAWLASRGALPLWLSALLLLAWARWEHRRDTAIHATPTFRRAAPTPDSSWPAAERRLRRMTAILARRANLAPPGILIQRRRLGHNLAAIKTGGKWTLAVTEPVVVAIDDRVLTGRPLAGILAHEIAHMAQDRPWHHFNRPLRASVLSIGLVATLAAPWTGQWIAIVALWLVASVVGALDRLISQSLELRADALAVELTGDTQDLRLGMAVMSILDVLAFEPLPRHLAGRLADELRIFGDDLGSQIQVAGQPLGELASRVEREARGAAPRRMIAAGLILGDWPESHPGPARRLALLADLAA